MKRSYLLAVLILAVAGAVWLLPPRRGRRPVTGRAPTADRRQVAAPERAAPPADLIAGKGNVSGIGTGKGQGTVERMRGPTDGPGGPSQSAHRPKRLSGDALTFSPPPGRHAGPIEVAIATNLPGAVIRYTLDGSSPTLDSPAYGGPVPLRQGTVVRAAPFNGSERLAPTASASYFLGAPPPGALPVISISADPGDFAAVHLAGEMRGREYEKPAYLEAFDPQGRRLAAAPFGLRLHGGFGRHGGMETKKSYRAYFRKVYGASRLDCPLIPDSPLRQFDRLVFRAGYNDRMRPGRGEYNVKAAYIRDQVLRDLHREMGFPAARGTWCLLYVNMEPRGLYNVTERADQHFASAYLGEGDWDVLNSGDLLSGTTDAWRELERLVATRDLSTPQGLAEARRTVDLDEFTGYMLLNLWAQNFDWPHHNWFAARKREPGSRWIFLCWDEEWGMGLRPWGYNADALGFLLGNQQGGIIRDLFRGLLGNAEYRSYLLKEMDRHLAGALRPENVLRHVARERDLVAPVMEREIDRFYRAGSLPAWEANVREMERFARGRGPVFESQMRSSLSDFSSPGARPAVRSGRLRF